MKLSFLFGFVLIFTFFQTAPAPHIVTWETLMRIPEVKNTFGNLMKQGRRYTAAQYLRCVKTNMNSSKGIIGTNGFTGQKGIITTNGKCFVGQNGIIFTNGKIFNK